MHDIYLNLGDDIQIDLWWYPHTSFMMSKLISFGRSMDSALGFSHFIWTPEPVPQVSRSFDTPVSKPLAIFTPRVWTPLVLRVKTISCPNASSPTFSHRKHKTGSVTSKVKCWNWATASTIHIFSFHFQILESSPPRYNQIMPLLKHWNQILYLWRKGWLWGKKRYHLPCQQRLRDHPIVPTQWPD